MIKINLLPAYILESRRVKAMIVLMAVLVLLLVGGLSAYVWAPAASPIKSLTAQKAEAQQKDTEAQAARQKVDSTTQEAQQIASSVGAKREWVKWVSDADMRPTMWVRYFQMLNKYIPSDVVVNGFPLPSNGNLQLSGSTSDLKAATRWYLNMLRCEMVVPGAVSFSPPGIQGWPRQAPASGPMSTPVALNMTLKPEYIPPLSPVPAPAGVSSAGGSGRGGMGGGGMGGGRMGGGGMGGGRMGGGRMGGGGMGGGGRMGGGGMGPGGGPGRG